MTGFRFAWGGAQANGVTPDLCTLGKTIGGGLPLAAVAGRADLMRLFDNQAGAQWLMQVGTLSGNPLASVAGLATLEVLSRPGTYEVMHDYGQRIQQMLHDALAPTGIPFQIVGDPMLFDVVFAGHRSAITAIPLPPTRPRKALSIACCANTAFSRARQDLPAPCADRGGSGPDRIRYPSRSYSTDPVTKPLGLLIRLSPGTD